MKKRQTLIVLALVCALALSACGCKHETWKDANCEDPKTCAECGEIEGEALGHAWADADCENPRTCTNCNLTEGETLSHVWADADCENPRTCTNCDLTEGEALGHIWMDATTETPKTCEICDETEGERILTDPRFTTESTMALHGEWESTIVTDGHKIGAFDVHGYEGTVTCKLILLLNQDGTSVMYVRKDDVSDLREYLLDALYKEYGLYGLDQEAADAVVLQATGWPLEVYLDIQLSVLDYMAIMVPYNHSGVYYVEQGVLYNARTWDDEMMAETFFLDGDTLTLINKEKGYTLVFTRSTGEE